MLDINASYHWMQLQEKLRDQTWENEKKKTSFGSDFCLFGPNLDCKIFFFKNLALPVTRCHGPCRIKKKLMIQFLENLVTDGQTDRQADRQADRFANKPKIYHALVNFIYKKQTQNRLSIMNRNCRLCWSWLVQLNHYCVFVRSMIK